MAGLSRWLRGRAGAVAAVLFAFLAVTPTLDAIVCADDGAAAVLTAAVSDPGDPAPDSDHGAAHDDACVHGHCHHGLNFILAFAEAAPAPARESRLHQVAQRTALTSHATFSIERPPRA